MEKITIPELHSWLECGRTLEYDKVLQLIARRAKGECGRQKIIALYPGNNKVLLEGFRTRIDQTMQAILNNQMFKLAPYDSGEEIIRMLRLEGHVLELEMLLVVRALLRQINSMQQWFDSGGSKADSRAVRYPALYSMANDLEPASVLLKIFDKVLDEEGHVKPDASPELMRLRKYQLAKRGEINKVFQQTVQKYRKQGWLSDTEESIRNGRRVLSMPAEHKRKLRGIIHDESSTGKTAFVEPEEIIELNNELFDAEMAERREIYRILGELTGKVAAHAGQLKKYEHFQTELDVLQAVAHTATNLKWFLPALSGEPVLDIRKGYHPLLLWKNEQQGIATIPFNLDTAKNRIVVLSGPNAGGKSVTLKATGLLVMMGMAGLPIPANEDSTIGTFSVIMADIGDKQSLDDDLSTYSSHLLMMKRMLDAACSTSLLLIDEFGSGTDPEFGGAIAESLLHTFRQKQSTCMVTTHFNNLKMYAHKTSGVVNAGMLFDMETIRPTFRLEVGRPGSSFAFEIAERSGLPKNILQRAAKNSGTQKHEFDRILARLQTERNALEQERDAAARSKAEAEKLIKNYEQLHRELEFRRKKLKLEQRKEDVYSTERQERELQQLIKELKESKDLEKAKALAAAKKKERETQTREAGQLQDAVKQELRSRAAVKGPLKAGDHVRLLGGTSSGVIESIQRKKAVVIMGALKLTVPLTDLQHAGEALPVNTAKSIQTEIQSGHGSVKSKLDLRGMHRKEAEAIFHEYLDKAMLSNLSTLSVIHGKGDGVLRKLVHEILRDYPHIRSWEHEPEDQGGDGVTIVRL